MTEAEGYVDVDFTGSHLTGKIGREIETTLASLRQSVHTNQFKMLCVGCCCCSKILLYIFINSTNHLIFVSF
jgi:hypothetical protein